MLLASEVERILETHGGAYRDRIYPPMRTLELFVGKALSAAGA